MHLLRQTWSIQSGNKLPASLMVHINNCLVTPPVTASISPARLPTLSIRDAMHIRLSWWIEIKKEVHLLPSQRRRRKGSTR